MDIIACEFCKIVFIGSDSVFAALCGHLFHEICLMKRFAGNARFCPKCYVTCDPSKSLRVFLPFSQETSMEESLVIKLKTMKHDRAEVQKELLHDELVLSVLDARVERAKETINQKNQKMSELKALYKEKENLQKKLKELEKVYSVQIALAGTSRKVDKMLQQKPQPDTLATMAVALKIETKQINTEKEAIRSEMRGHRKESKKIAANFRNRRDKLEIALARSINKRD